MTDRIDVHSHFLTPDDVAALSKTGIRDVDGYPLPEWSVERCAFLHLVDFFAWAQLCRRRHRP